MSVAGICKSTQLLTVHWVHKPCHNHYDAGLGCLQPKSTNRDVVACPTVVLVRDTGCLGCTLVLSCIQRHCCKMEENNVI